MAFQVSSVKMLMWSQTMGFYELSQLNYKGLFANETEDWPDISKAFFRVSPSSILEMSIPDSGILPCKDTHMQVCNICMLIAHMFFLYKSENQAYLCRANFRSISCTVDTPDRWIHSSLGWQREWAECGGRGRGSVHLTPEKQAKHT